MKRRKFIQGSAMIGFSLAAPSVIGCSGLMTPKSSRKVHMILDAGKSMVGTLPILRAFAGNHLDYVSPFVMFDEFGPVEVAAGSDPLRVDAHPHAGVVPTTYFLKGTGHHKDSLKYDIQIGKGDFMMFSSGKGAIHMEETGQKLYDEGGAYHGFQIWLNMPAEYKFVDPSTHVYREDMMDSIEEKDYRAKVVLGDLFGAKSGIETLSPAFYYHIHMQADCRLDIPVHPEHNAFVYLVDGQVELESQRKLNTHQLALYERGDDLINLYAKDAAEVLVLGGQPLNEPVYSYGPFVMNNEEQIKRCIADYRNGRMGDPRAVN